MAKKPKKPFRPPVLRHFTVREITDPAEQATLDERIRRSRLEADAGAPVVGGDAQQRGVQQPGDNGPRHRHPGQRQLLRTIQFR